MLYKVKAASLLVGLYEAPLKGVVPPLSKGPLGKSLCDSLLPHWPGGGTWSVLSLCGSEAIWTGQRLPLVSAEPRHCPNSSPPCVCPQSDPEFVQWKKELTETFMEAQRLLRRAPKFLNKSRSAVVELSKPPLCHRNSNGL